MNGYIVLFTVADLPVNKLMVQDRKTDAAPLDVARTMARTLKAEGARNVRIIEANHRGTPPLRASAVPRDPCHCRYCAEENGYVPFMPEAT